MLDGSERRDRSRARVLLVACVSGDGNILNVTHPGFDSEHQVMLDRVPRGVSRSRPFGKSRGARLEWQNE